MATLEYRVLPRTLEELETTGFLPGDLGTPWLP